MGIRVFIENVVLSYPHLFQPRAVKPGDPPKYGGAVLIPKNNPALALLQQAEAQAKQDRWGANIPPTAKALPLYDGDTDPRYNTVPANHGHMILNSSAKDQPLLVDLGLQPIINPATLYAGAIVNVDVGIYIYGDEPGSLSKGVASGLNGVQFVQDGPRLDSRPSAQEMFGAPAGAPPPIAPGVQGQPVQQPVQQVAPAGNPYAQPAPQPPAAAPYPAGSPAQGPAVAPQPTGAPTNGNPSFLG